ncbi:MAG: hypothetical protein WBK28_00130 [Minisyncoccia bacterium]
MSRPRRSQNVSEGLGNNPSAGEAQKRKPSPELKVVNKPTDGIESFPSQKPQRKRPVYAQDLGLLFESAKSANIREGARRRAAYLREKYKNQKPPTDLETITQLGKAFMSPEKRAVLEEREENQAIMKKVRVDSRAPLPLKKPLPVRWFKKFTGMIAALAAFGAAIQTPEVQSRIGSPSVRALAQERLARREELRGIQEETKAATDELERRTTGFDAHIDEMVSDTETLRELARNPELINSLEGFSAAETPEMQRSFESALENMGYRPVLNDSGEYTIIPIVQGMDGEGEPKEGKG